MPSNARGFSLCYTENTVGWLSGLRHLVANQAGVAPRGFESHTYLQTRKALLGWLATRFEPVSAVTVGVRLLCLPPDTRLGQLAQAAGLFIFCHQWLFVYLVRQ